MERSFEQDDAANDAANEMAADAERYPVYRNARWYDLTREQKEAFVVAYHQYMESPAYEGYPLVLLGSDDDRLADNENEWLDCVVPCQAAIDINDGESLVIVPDYAGPIPTAAARARMRAEASEEPLVVDDLSLLAGMMPTGMRRLRITDRSVMVRIREDAEWAAGVGK